jgi:carbon storage regulator CsrA
MLVLSRRLHEKIVFPGLGITVQVVGTKKGSVQMGITAPPEVPIRREEVVDKPRARAEQPGQDELCPV